MPSNPFSKIQISLNYDTGHTVQWTLDPLFTGRAPYTFTLYAYQDSGFHEAIWAKPVGAAFFGVDDTNIRQNSLNSYLYKVKLVTADGKEFWSNFVGWQPGDASTQRKYLNASEITRKQWVGLRLWGLWGYLIKRKVYSPLAVADLDPVTGEPITDSSTGSFGTGFTDGYFNPVLFKYFLVGHKETLDFQTEGRGTDYREDIDIKTVGFPFLEAKDILVTVEGKRYLIGSVDDKFYPGTTISIQQEVPCQVIPPTDTVYSIPVPAFPND